MTGGVPAQRGRSWQVARPIRRNGFASAGFVFLLLAGGTACATSSGSRRSETPTALQAVDHGRPGWSRLQTVAAGAEVEVRLYDEAETVETPARFALRPLGRLAPAMQDGRQDGRIVKGRLHAATADALTLALEDGCRHRWDRRAVRLVKVRRPFFARPAGWIAFGVATAFMLRALLPPEDLSAGAVPLMLSYTAFPASLPFFFVSPMKTVYAAPPADRGQGEIDSTAARTCD